jgi:prevent-host-death family protein
MARRTNVEDALRTTAFACNLVSMTSIDPTPAKLPRPRNNALPGHWVLQDAKARFSELVRRVRSEGPQHVTVHGRDEVVVISAEEFRRLRGEHSGQSLIDALQASPCRDIDLEPVRSPMPVRSVVL